MDKQTQPVSGSHLVTLKDRARADITGVTEVRSFDEESVSLSTVCGDLTVEGENLHVGALDIARGTVTVEGRVNGLYYSTEAPAKRGWRRLFG